MIRFLNRLQIIEELFSIIQKAKQEVLLMAPFIRTTPELYQELTKASDRGVQIFIIHRDGMKEDEKEKLSRIENLSILSHQNVHSKCYLNEASMVICSMNLYDRRYEKNREMGVFFHKHHERQAYVDAIAEIDATVRASEFVVKSKILKGKSFKIGLLERFPSFVKEHQEQINQHFAPKRFELLNHYHDSEFTYQSKPFVEELTLKLQCNHEQLKSGMIYYVKRALVTFEIEQDELSQIHDKHSDGFAVKGFKVFWENLHQPMSLYLDKRVAKEIPFTKALVEYDNAIGSVITRFRKYRRSIL